MPNSWSAKPEAFEAARIHRQDSMELERLATTLENAGVSAADARSAISKAYIRGWRNALVVHRVTEGVWPSGRAFAGDTDNTKVSM